MTQHLLRISNDYTLMVSDRLVSGEINDPLANKTILYEARDAIVTIAYTGLAYELDSSNLNIPTDEWIAAKLWGESIPSLDGQRPAAFRFGTERPAGRMDIGQTIEMLRSSLEESIKVLPSDRRKLAFELLVAGWQISGEGRARPIFVDIDKPKGSAEVTVKYQQRRWYLPPSKKLSAEEGKAVEKAQRTIALIKMPDDFIRNDELQNLSKSLSRASADECESLLVDRIREVAKTYPKKVGPHCLSVLLPHPTYRWARVRFIPNVQHVARVTTKTGSQVVPVAYSPWIIGFTMFSAPSLMLGSSVFSMGTVQVIMEAPESKEGIIGIISSLKRPEHPKSIK